jgi:PIN domain nuclease of toxin-antitoxin system
LDLLLDTTYVYALADKISDLTARETALLAAPPGKLVVSAVSLWEIKLKWNALHRDGTRKGLASPDQILSVLTPDLVDRLNLTWEHAAAELIPPLSHGDPFDDMLLVQAQVEGLKLLTRDNKLKIVA